jgi:hypothetical protein
MMTFSFFTQLVSFSVGSEKGKGSTKNNKMPSATKREIHWETILLCIKG